MLARLEIQIRTIIIYDVAAKETIHAAGYIPWGMPATCSLCELRPPAVPLDSNLPAEDIMRSNVASGPFTRCLVDGEHNIEMAELSAVMQKIQEALGRVVPASHQAYVGNALLNLALTRMVREAGTQNTATMLIRLVDAVIEHGAPPMERAIDLSATHS